MIGVIVNSSEEELVKEFFELFKTPWEFYRTGHSYDVVICSVEDVKEINAKLIIIYGSKENSFDRENSIETNRYNKEPLLAYDGSYLPIYGDILTFGGTNKVVAKVRETPEAAGIEIDAKNKKILRIGFDLFQEIKYLLSHGQPTEHANIPTIEVHISMLRDWILNAGIPLIEIPPVPAGNAFIVCLTHDVDFIGIRNHKFDHTLFGFIYRALFGSFFGVLRGRRGWRELLKNWKAVLSLPAVYLGLAKDFMVQFGRYREIEKGLCSTFFIIPYKNRSGQDISGRIPKKRAARYDITEILPEVKRLVSDGCEVGLHGIEAWRDPEEGRKELERISHIVGESDIGVRMHWLYYCEQSPQILDEAGFCYDTTCGYNDAVGYRGGTTQVFRPPGTKKLMELPMHIQDTSLFYPSRMGLTETEAADHIKGLLENSTRHGGVLTFNWHQRSIGPERLWDSFYVNLVDNLKKRNAWFGTARGVVTWFKKRRAALFDKVCLTENKLHVRVVSPEKNYGPDLSLKIHIPETNERRETGSIKANVKQIDIPVSDELDVVISVDYDNPGYTINRQA